MLCALGKGKTIKFTCHNWTATSTDNITSFNSYTQQICIDDAVVMDPDRSENVVTNDGTTMRIMAQKSATPSAWTRQKEVLVENPATAVLVANARKAVDETKLIEEQLAAEEAEEAEKAEGESCKPR